MIQTFKYDILANPRATKSERAGVLEGCEARIIQDREAMLIEVPAETAAIFSK